MQASVADSSSSDYACENDVESLIAGREVRSKKVNRPFSPGEERNNNDKKRKHAPDTASSRSDESSENDVESLIAGKEARAKKANRPFSPGGERNSKSKKLKHAPDTASSKSDESSENNDVTLKDGRAVKTKKKVPLLLKKAKKAKKAKQVSVVESLSSGENNDTAMRKSTRQKKLYEPFSAEKATKVKTPEEREKDRDAVKRKLEIRKLKKDRNERVTRRELKRLEDDDNLDQADHEEPCTDDEQSDQDDLKLDSELRKSKKDACKKTVLIPFNQNELEETEIIEKQARVPSPSNSDNENDVPDDAYDTVENWNLENKSEAFFINNKMDEKNNQNQLIPKILIGAEPNSEGEVETDSEDEVETAVNVETELNSKVLNYSPQISLEQNGHTPPQSPELIEKCEILEEDLISPIKSTLIEIGKLTTLDKTSIIDKKAAMSICKFPDPGVTRLNYHLKTGDYYTDLKRDQKEDDNLTKLNDIMQNSPLSICFEDTTSVTTNESSDTPPLNILVYSIEKEIDSAIHLQKEENDYPENITEDLSDQQKIDFILQQPKEEKDSPKLSDSSEDINQNLSDQQKIHFYYSSQKKDMDFSKLNGFYIEITQYSSEQEEIAFIRQMQKPANFDEQAYLDDMTEKEKEAVKELQRLNPDLKRKPSKWKHSERLVMRPMSVTSHIQEEGQPKRSGRVIKQRSDKANLIIKQQIEEQMKQALDKKEEFDNFVMKQINSMVKKAENSNKVMKKTCRRCTYLLTKANSEKCDMYLWQPIEDEAKEKEFDEYLNFTNKERIRLDLAYYHYQNHCKEDVNLAIKSFEDDCAEFSDIEAELFKLYFFINQRSFSFYKIAGKKQRHMIDFYYKSKKSVDYKEERRIAMTKFVGLTPIQKPTCCFGHKDKEHVKEAACLITEPCTNTSVLYIAGNWFCNKCKRDNALAKIHMFVKLVEKEKKEALKKKEKKGETTSGSKLTSSIIHCDKEIKRFCA